MRQVFVIGVTGGSGSGKSSLLTTIRSAFEITEVAILSQDNYYRPRHLQVKDEAGIRNFDLPESFEMQEFLVDLKRLGEGETITRTEYTYNNEQAEPSLVVVEPAPVIVAEGLFLLHLEELRSQIDLKVFVEVNDVLKLKRRIIRDQMERNYPLEDVLYRYEHHVLPAYRKYILPFRDEADIVINNNESMEPALEMITGYVKNLLGLPIHHGQ